ncbi:MAG: ParB/RepB/Spo0J family partition protein [Bryobacteraceae bacterium]
MNKPHDGPRRVLGKGLSALLPPKVATSDGLPPVASALPTSLPIGDIDPNPLQPRRIFDQTRLEELAQSIRANGIVQPLVVRPSADRYQLVAGERRWRAAQLAGLDHVPVVVQDISDDHLLEVTLVENIQREDLNPIETALAFQRLIQELHLTQEQIGQRTGKDRTTISNLLRLLQLPADIQQLIAERRLSPGHARCLLGLTAEDQRELAERVVAQGLSVRETERLTQRLTEPRRTRTSKEAAALDPNVRAAIEEMERTLGTRVRVVPRSPVSGRIEIEYYSVDDLDRIYSTIVGDGAATS